MSDSHMLLKDMHGLHCPECNNRDANSFYAKDKPHLYCHKCGHSEYNIEKVEEVVLMGDSSVVRNIDTAASKSTMIAWQKGMIQSLNHRGIGEEASRRYGVETLYDDKDVAVSVSFPTHNKNGDLVAQKIKPISKTTGSPIRWVGNHSEARMFGINRFSMGGKYLTITEGEEDCLACWQMLRDANRAFEPSVISIKDGATSALRDCKREWEYINSFDNIIIAFDGDEEGQSAAKDVAELFPHKVKIMNFSEYRKDNGVKRMKDSNDYLLAGRQSDFVNLWWKAEKFAPEGIRSFQSLWDDMVNPDTATTVPFPWDGVNKKMYGMRTGELLIFKAPPKVGKTQVLRELVYHIRTTTDYNIGALFLEDTTKSIGMGLCGLYLNKPLQSPDTKYTVEELKEAHEYLSKDDRIVIFDPHAERSAEKVLNRITHMAKGHGCKYIFLDHISMLAYQSGDGDERRFLDKFLADLKELTTTLNVCIMAIIHVNDDGKTRGSRAPVQLCNGLIGLVRDKLNPDPLIANTMEVIVEENRLTGNSGKACNLLYDTNTGRLNEIEDMVVEPTEESLREVVFDK